MRQIKTLTFLLILLFTITSCKRRHCYCHCQTPPNSTLEPYVQDWGKSNSINNFKHDEKVCEDKEKEGYTDCRFLAE